MKSKRLVTGGKIRLEWSDGCIVELGTVDIHYGFQETKVKVTPAKRFRMKVGWDIVRMGFRCMMPGREWKLDVNPETGQIDDKS